MAGKNPYTNQNKDISGLKDKVLITDESKKEKVKTAVALSYDADETAPKIIASGRGKLAERIIDVAKESDVPVHKDERLANTLSKLEVGDYIPQELYEVVAEVLLFVDKLDHIKEKVTKGKSNGYVE